MHPYRPKHSKYRAIAHSKDTTSMKAPWVTQKRKWGFFWKTIKVGGFTEMINLTRSLNKRDR